MRGRIFGVKKTSILIFSLIFNVALTVTLIFLSIFLWKNPFLWYFLFCICAGMHSLTKAALFKLDSAAYLGFLLLFIGVAGTVIYALNLEFKYFFLMTAAGLASLVTYILTGQKFHIYLSILLVSSAALSYLYCLEILNLAVFLTIYLLFLFIFSIVCAILLMQYLKKG